jgi:hypothetical protein
MLPEEIVVSCYLLVVSQTDIMKNDFIIVQQRPTPDELLRAIIQIVPDFGAYWNQPDNYFRNDDGSSSVGGIFSELSAYIRENFSNLKEATRAALFDLK